MTDLTTRPWFDHGQASTAAEFHCANFTPNEAVSLVVVTESQEETDRYWDAMVGNGGAASARGWCRNRWGSSWQITPRRLLDLTTSSDRANAKRAFEATMTMQKIDIAALDAPVSKA